MPATTYPIYWLLIERTPASHSEAGAFLSAGERQKLSAMRFLKRRDEWLLGRWAAKTLIRSLPDYQDYSPAEIEIVNDANGAPLFSLPGAQISPDRLSISHSGQLALCGLTQVPTMGVGVDLEKIEPRSEDFIQDYFTPDEQRLVGSFPPKVKHTAVTLIWSMKEAMLKALGVGLRRDTRQVEVHTLGDGNPGDWQEASVGEPQTEKRPWLAWWQRRGDYVMTMAALAEGLPEPFSVSLIEQHVGLQSK